MAEEGGPPIVVEGSGIRVIDSEGQQLHRLQRRLRLGQPGVWPRRDRRRRPGSDAQAGLLPAGVDDGAGDPPAGEAGGGDPRKPRTLVAGHRRVGGERDGGQDREGLPQAQGRGGAVQDNQPEGLLPRRHGRGDVDGGGGPRRLWAELPRYGLCAAAESPEPRARRRDGVRVRRPVRGGRREADRVPRRGHGRGGDRRADSVARDGRAEGGAGRGVLADAPADMRPSRRAPDRRRGGVRLRAHGQVVRRGALRGGAGT